MSWIATIILGILVFFPKCHLEKLLEIFSSTPTKLTQQVTVIEKKFPQYYRDGENVLSVRNGIKNCFFEMMAKLDHFFVMATEADKRPKGDSGTIFRGS